MPSKIPELTLPLDGVPEINGVWTFPCSWSLTEIPSWVGSVLATDFFYSSHGTF